MKYDVFISYRRDDGAQYARILQLELEKRNYRVFLDYEEITDGIFGDEIKEAIRSAPIFIMVLTPLYLERSMEKDSWVREEINLAIEDNKHFIPIDPDKRFNGVPKNTPENIAYIVSNHQHSYIEFGQTLELTIDLMVRKRIAPHIGRKKISRWKNLVFVFLGLLVIIGIGCFLYFQYTQNLSSQEILRLKALAEVKAKLIEEKCEHNINWSPNITTEQVSTIYSILDNMEEVQGGEFMQGAFLKDSIHSVDLICPELEIPASAQSVETFFMCIYEVSVSDWGVIMQQPFDHSDSLQPKVNVTYHECLTFTKKLADLTGLNFRLPTETEWEYAARGGKEPDKTVFAGSDDPQKVAWYCKNSKGKAYICDASNTPLTCNALNLYYMSGNVSEWTSSLCYPYNQDEAIPDDSALAVRGGNYDSYEREITVFHREPVNPNDKDATIGLRLVISK